MTDQDDTGYRDDDLPGQPRRSSFRYPLRRPVEIRCEHWEQFVGLCTENVSRNGLLVRLADPLPVGTSTEVRLVAPNRTVITLQGEVTRIVAPIQKGGEPGMAIRILEPTLKELEDQAVAISITRAQSEPEAPRPSAYGTNGPPSKIPHGRWLFGDSDAEASSGELEIDLGSEEEEANPEIDFGLVDDRNSMGVEVEPAPYFGSTTMISGTSLEEDMDEEGEQRPTDPVPDRQAISKIVARRPSGVISSPGRYIKTFSGGRPTHDRPSVADILLCGPPPKRDEPPPEEPKPGRSPDFSPPRSTYPPPISPDAGVPRTTPLPPRIPTMVGRAAPIIGLDFGTTYSKVAFAQSNEVVLIEEEGCQSANPAAIPSVVAFPEVGAPPLVGHPARELQPERPSCVIPLVKRLLGRRYHDPMVDGVLGTLACRSFAGPDDAIILEVNGEEMTVVQVVSHILRHLKSLADTYTGSNVKQAVLTAPVDFDDRAQRELKLAARIAGLETVAIIPEPTAAVIGCGRDGSREAVVGVVDFGGGTLDVSIVEVRQSHYDVLGSGGDRWLGGADFDAAIARFAADEFYRSTGLNLHKQTDQLLRLHQVCEEAKRWLSTLPLADVILPEAGHTADGPQTLLVPVTRACMEELTSELIVSTMAVCEHALAQSGCGTKGIDEVLITGGTTRIPVVREAVRRFFGREPQAGIHPENAVVMGAAVYAAMLSGVRLTRRAIERLMGKGVVGQSIGIALADGTTEPIIERTKRPPLAAFRLYGTARDNQDACSIKLFEGDRQLTSENTYLGGFIFDGLPPGPRGSIDIEVYFELSSTGTLCVTAQERSSGRRHRQTFDLGLA